MAITKSELTNGASMEAQPSQWNIDSTLSLKEWDVALVTLSKVRTLNEFT
jgi:hypothetical protein